MTTRTIAVGDIHGCSAALSALLDVIQPVRTDVLVFLGDYIDRGPDSRGVLDQVIALCERCGVVPLLGNHEEMLLLARSDPAVRKGWLACGGLAALESYGRAGGLDLVPELHWRFLESCLDWFETDTHIFVHANYLPQLPMERQPKQFLHWEFLSEVWARPHRSGKTVVLGHTPQRGGEVLDLGFLKCIDTFCQGGQWLTALEVHTGQVWQANSRGELRP